MSHTLVDSKYLSIIENGTKEEALAAAEEAGKEYAPLYFDYRDADWDNALYYVRIEEENGKKFPVLYCDGTNYDFSTVMKEIHEAGRENPIFSATEEGDDALDAVKDTFRQACEENFDAIEPIKNLISSLRQNLAVFLPILPGPDACIPQERISGCNIESDEWKALVEWAKTHIIEAESNRPIDVCLTELHQNASYGGEPGLVVLLDGKDFLRWVDEKSIWPVIQGFAKTKASLAIYDFGNGSGHDTEGMAIDWKKVTEPQNSKVGIVNNFIDCVFGLVGISRIHIPESLPNHGSGCYSNPWI